MLPNRMFMLLSFQNHSYHLRKTFLHTGASFAYSGRYCRDLQIYPSNAG